ncbi:MAG: hypothetical protein ACYDG4_08705 [Desulfuromonadaceae bacterium]
MNSQDVKEHPPLYRIEAVVELLDRGHFSRDEALDTIVKIIHGEHKLRQSSSIPETPDIPPAKILSVSKD